MLAGRARRSIVAALLALAVMVGAYVVAHLLASPSGDQVTGSADSSAPSGIGGEPVPPRPADAQPMTVREVHDGDTVWLQAKTAGEAVDTTRRVRVRLIGVDTPEVQPTSECWAAEATDHLRALAPIGTTVYVTADRDPKDRYGRWLLYLWTPSGTFVNYDLVAGGWGEPLRIYPNVAYWPLLEAAGDQARSDRRGLWSSC